MKWGEILGMYFALVGLLFLMGSAYIYFSKNKDPNDSDYAGMVQGILIVSGYFGIFFVFALVYDVFVNGLRVSFLHFVLGFLALVLLTLIALGIYHKDSRH